MPMEQMSGRAMTSRGRTSVPPCSTTGAARHRRRRRLRPVRRYESCGGHRSPRAAGGADQEALSVRFPPVMPWTNFVKNGYLESFPDQMGRSTRSAATRRAMPSSCTREEGLDAPAPRVDDMVSVRGVPPAVPTQSGTLPEGGRSSRSTATASGTSRAPIPSGCRRSVSTTTSTSVPPRGTRHRDAGSSAASTCSATRAERRVVWPTTRSSAVPAGCWRPTSAPRSFKYEDRHAGVREGRETAIRRRTATSTTSPGHSTSTPRTGRRHIRRASASAWTGSPSPCSTTTAPTRRWPPSAGRAVALGPTSREGAGMDGWTLTVTADTFVPHPLHASSAAGPRPTATSMCGSRCCMPRPGPGGRVRVHTQL